jgi:AcrR family transcriptional regulator
LPRRRLLGAARDLIAEKGVGAMRTSEITDRADVGAGSFYNHFADKDEIVAALLAELAEEQGALVDELTRGIDDPAEVVSFAHRHFVRLALRDPSFGQLVIRLNASHGLMQRTLGHRALRDIQAGIEIGRFKVADPLPVVYATGGALLGTIAGVVDGSLCEGADQDHAAAVLRMLGLEADEAGAISALPIDRGRSGGS